MLPFLLSQVHAYKKEISYYLHLEGNISFMHV